MFLNIEVFQDLKIFFFFRKTKWLLDIPFHVQFETRYRVHYSLNPPLSFCPRPSNMVLSRNLVIRREMRWGVFRERGKKLGFRNTKKKPSVARSHAILAKVCGLERWMHVDC